MPEIWRPGTYLLAVFIIELPLVAPIDCLYGKELCRIKGSCKKSLDCKWHRYDLFHGCVKPKVKKEEYRECDGGENCYWEVDKCDGVVDCIDGQDEDNCCPPGAHRCDFKDRDLCYNNSHICDGEIRCRDKSDEKNCRKCFPHETPCDLGTQCFTLQQVCNGFPNCEDSADENGCVPYSIDKDNNQDDMHVHDDEGLLSGDAMWTLIVVVVIVVVSSCGWAIKSNKSNEDIEDNDIISPQSQIDIEMPLHNNRLAIDRSPSRARNTGSPEATFDSDMDTPLTAGQQAGHDHQFQTFHYYREPRSGGTFRELSHGAPASPQNHPDIPPTAPLLDPSSPATPLLAPSAPTAPLLPSDGPVLPHVLLPDTTEPPPSYDSLFPAHT